MRRWESGCCKALRGKGIEIDDGGFAFQEVSHDDGGCRGQQDAVAEVAGGEEVGAVLGACAEDGEGVCSCWAQTGPGFYLGGVVCGGELGEELGC